MMDQEVAVSGICITQYAGLKALHKYIIWLPDYIPPFANSRFIQGLDSLVVDEPWREYADYHRLPVEPVLDGDGNLLYFTIRHDEDDGECDCDACTMRGFETIDRMVTTKTGLKVPIHHKIPITRWEALKRSIGRWWRRERWPYRKRDMYYWTVHPNCRTTMPEPITSSLPVIDDHFDPNDGIYEDIDPYCSDWEEYDDDGEDE